MVSNAWPKGMSQVYKEAKQGDISQELLKLFTAESSEVKSFILAALPKMIGLPETHSWPNDEELFYSLKDVYNMQMMWIQYPQFESLLRLPE